MIALVLAAAVAALTPQELSKAVDAQIAAQMANVAAGEQSVQQLRARVSFVDTVQRFQRQVDCDDQNEYLRAAQILQGDVDSKSVLILDPTLAKHLGGIEYHLSPDELQVVVAKVHELQYDAQEKRVACED